MKKLFLIISLLFFSISSRSQVLMTLILGDKLNSDGLEFGLEGGINWTLISNLETQTYANKFNLGFYFDIRVKKQWSIYTGTLVKANLGVDKLSRNDLKLLNVELYKNADNKEIEGVYSHKMNYFLVPILLKYKFKNHMYFELGTQIGLMYKSWIEFNSDIDGKESIIKDYNKGEINNIDAGAMVGVGYKLLKGTGWTIGVKYYYGLVDVYKNMSGNKNSSIFLKLNIPVGAGEKPERKKNN